MLIAVEGIDSVGKETQVKMLSSALQGMGLSTFVQSFPAYESNDHGRLIAQYLCGKLGNLHPYAVATLFACDRLSVHTAGKLTQDIDVTILDRYVASNIVYQGARIKDSLGRRAFSSWIEDLEYVKCGFPRPDLTIYLKLNSAVAYDLAKKRGKPDIYEQAIRYMDSCSTHYDELALHPTWAVVDCNDYLSQTILSQGLIHYKVLHHVVAHYYTL